MLKNKNKTNLNINERAIISNFSDCMLNNEGEMQS